MLHESDGVTKGSCLTLKYDQRIYLLIMSLPATFGAIPTHQVNPQGARTFQSALTAPNSMAPMIPRRNHPPKETEARHRNRPLPTDFSSVGVYIDPAKRHFHRHHPPLPTGQFEQQHRSATSVKVPQIFRYQCFLVSAESLTELSKSGWRCV